MENWTCWSYEIISQREDPFPTVKKLVPYNLCIRWTERLG